MLSVDDNNKLTITRGLDACLHLELESPDGKARKLRPGESGVMLVYPKGATTPEITVINKEGDGFRFTPNMTTRLLPGTYTYTVKIIFEDWVETVIDGAEFEITGADYENINRYKSLLTSQYRYSSKLNTWLLSLLSIGLTHRPAYMMLINAFELDTAVGKQLDAIGRIVGAVRELDFTPADGSSRTLGDKTYRLIIKAAIIKNYWSGRIHDLYDAWALLFPRTKFIQIQDLQNMTCNVNIAGDYTPLERELIVKGYIVPKPAGVRLQIAVTPTEGFPIFSYDRNDLHYSGYTANWIIREGDK